MVITKFSLTGHTGIVELCTIVGEILFGACSGRIKVILAGISQRKVKRAQAARVKALTNTIQTYTWPTNSTRS